MTVLKKLLPKKKKKKRLSFTAHVVTSNETKMLTGEQARTPSAALQYQLEQAGLMLLRKQEPGDLSCLTKQT